MPAALYFVICMRLDATMRRPASSSILVTAPVRLRRVASGLMIEKVRVAVLRAKLRYVAGNWVGPAFSRACVSSQGATEIPILLHGPFPHLPPPRRQTLGSTPSFFHRIPSPSPPPPTLSSPTK